MFLGDLPILRLNDHPPRSENPTMKSWVAPWVSNAKGWKMWVAGRSAYLDIFLFAAASTAPPADWDDRWTYESARMLTTVTSQVSGLPLTLVSPLSIRALAVSFCQAAWLLGHWDASYQDLAITSLIAWCLVVLFGAFLHTKPWRPCVSTRSTGDPQRQVWATQHYYC